MTKVKICGLSRETDIEYANRLLPDYIGFVFAKKSRRYLEPERAARLKAQLDTRIQAVGVFVNEPVENIRALAEKGTIDIIQLHGSEDENDIRRLRAVLRQPIIKAFRISSPHDIETAVKSSADYILLDNGSGGTGEAFDWSYISGIDRPFFLAGGLSGANVAEAVQSYRPYAVDISSGVETGGYKDYEKMKDFIAKVRK